MPMPNSLKWSPSENQWIEIQTNHWILILDQLFGVGGYGPRSQHSFFQHLFQGNRETNSYFIASENDDLNFKQFKGQTKSLRDGTLNESDSQKRVLPKRYTTVLLKNISPESLGELIAIWENKTIFMSMFWNINPFDQWGVELGKLNTKKEIE